MSTRDPRPERDQPLLTLLAVTATFLVLPVVVLAGGLNVIAVPAVVLAAGLVAAGRNSVHALVALLILAGVWLVAGPREITAWSLVMATLLLVIHGAVALRGSVPPGAAVDSQLARRWLQRGASVMAATALVYLAGVAVRQLDRGDSEVVVVLALFVLGGLVLLLRSESLSSEAP